jgi:hypothetical protein
MTNEAPVLEANIGAPESPRAIAVKLSWFCVIFVLVSFEPKG